MLEHQRPLPQIIEHQRREDEHEPGELDRLAAEMAEVGIKRFRPRDRQEHRPQHDDSQELLPPEEADGVPGVEGGEDTEIVGDVEKPSERHGDEPEHRDRPEELRHDARTVRLNGEEAEENADGDENDVIR